MAALCGEIADGILMTRSTTATAGEIRTHLAEGASRAGRRPDEVTITSLLPTVVGDTRRQALDALRPDWPSMPVSFPDTTG
jgi:alkanesulfonate monooxygenase SsuD/methylene tetrahydromethanopterin reductase-like flavin-dependent oxidoreductase (luciferase family)